MPLPSEQGNHTLPIPQNSEPSRVLALDWGTKSVGLAISDPLGLTAQGLPTMERRNRRQDFNFLRTLIRKHNVSLILLGLPLNIDGTEGERAVRMRELAVDLRNHLNVDVQLRDERLTTVEANRILHEAGVKVARRRESVDRVAAALLLQEYLDEQPRTSHAEDQR
jgi:putative Holliday junction resolvase